MTTRTRPLDRDTARPPGPRGAEAVGTLARMASGRPLEACAGLFARYGDTVYLPVRPWPGLYIFSRPDQAEHVLAANQANYVKPFTYRPLRRMLGDGLLTAEEGTWRRHRRIIQPVFSTPNVASFAAEMDAAAWMTRVEPGPAGIGRKAASSPSHCPAASSRPGEGA